jgi:hypothetical protein
VFWDGKLSDLGETISIHASDGTIAVPFKYKGLSALRLTEIMYDPSDEDHEFLELKNTGDTALDVGGCEFTKGIELTIPLNTFVAPGAFLVIVRNNTLANGFPQKYPNVPFLATDYQGSLDNAGDDLLEFATDEGETILSFSYDDTAPWPTQTEGFSIVKRNPAGNPNEGEEWRLSSLQDGTPGADDSYYFPHRNLGAEFSAASNPSPGGRWSYGWKGTLDGSFNLVTVSGINSADDGTPLPYWQPDAGLEPAIFQNTANHSVTVGSGAAEIPAKAIFYGSGLNGFPQNYGVIRYTVGLYERGTYVVEGHLRGLYEGFDFGDSDFHIVVNGVEVLRREIEDSGRATYGRTITVNDGDTVDFMVGRGADLSGYGSQLIVEAKLKWVGYNPVVRHDVGEEFSPAANPSADGRWSYGWQESLGGPFELVTIQTDWNYSIEGVQILSWQLGIGEAPAFFWNPSGQTISFWEGRTYMPPHMMWFSAGQDGMPQNFAVTRYTVPASEAGNYVICTAVDSVYRNIAAGDSDFHLLINGGEFGAFDIPLGGWANYHVTVPLSAGDTVDFVVGRGADGIEYGSQVKLNAEVSRILP